MQLNLIKGITFFFNEIIFCTVLSTNLIIRLLRHLQKTDPTSKIEIILQNRNLLVALILIHKFYPFPNPATYTLPCQSPSFLGAQQ